MKKGIFLAGIVSFICYMGEAQVVLGDDVRSPEISVIFPSEGSDGIRLFVSGAESALFCRETCEETLKDFEIEETEKLSYGEACQKICGGIFRNIYQKKLAMEEEEIRKEKSDICTNIYRISDTRAGGRVDAPEVCYNLPYSLVVSIEEIHATLEDGEIDDLQWMDLVGFFNYIDISLSPLGRQIDRFTRVESKQFLAWLAGIFDGTDPELVNPIFSLDKDFNILRKLLRNIDVSPLTDALMTSISIRHQYNFFEIIAPMVGKGNSAAGEWVHNFIEKECEESDNEALCVLETYCSFHYSRGDETAKSLMKLPYFENFIDNVITGEVNKPNWRKQDFQFSGDLEQWDEDLCQ